MQQLRVEVTGLSGETLTLELDPEARFGEVKTSFEEKFGIEKIEQRLISGASVVKDEEKIATYAEDGCVELTLMTSTEPEVSEALKMLDPHSCCTQSAADACLDATNRLWGGAPERVLERRRAVAVLMHFHEAIVTALDRWQDDDLRRRGCAALANMCKCTPLESGTQAAEASFSAEGRRQAVADAGALEVLTDIIKDANCHVHGKENACLALERILADNSCGNKEVHAAVERRRKRSVEAGALKALIGFLSVPLTLAIRSAAVRALQNLVQKDEERVALALSLGAQKGWLGVS
eukprot:TRINITY_DN3201_c0_g1_i1.p1 TRINITY_DN3201_c0_g1~~TRINITY_DN3201_c0_g1_i1.p1  ORF type:complete len:306 (+),score=62.37 TRINITY_DN3201_c0_g1_i1:39-920(+)